MARKSQHHADDTHRTCNRCDEIKPLNSDHFGKLKSGPHGWKTRCKLCVQEVRTQKYYEKLNKMNESEHDSFRTKQRADNNKSRRNIEANETPEEREFRLHRRNLRDKIPSYLVKIKHLTFVDTLRDAGQTWSEFYNTLSECLRSAYDCEIGARHPTQGHMLGSGFSPEDTAFCERAQAMRKVDTFRMLNDINDTIQKWGLDGGAMRRALADMKAEIAALTPDEREWVKGYKPRADRGDDLCSLSPALRRDIESMVQAHADDGTTERVLKDYDSKIQDSTFWELIINFDVPNTETGLERKHRLDTLSWIEIHARMEETP